MVKKHLFRIAAPNLWEINRKKHKYVSHPSSGPHPINRAVPLLLIVREYLGYSKTSRESKKIINSGNISIDGIIRKDHRFPVGLMDVITIKNLNENYRVLFGKNKKLILHKIHEEETNIKPLKIINKTSVKRKRFQLNFFDGKNKLIDKDIYKTSDTLVYDFINKKFLDHIKFEKGSIIYLIDGKKTGHVGILDAIMKRVGNEPTKIVLTSGKEKFETLKDYVFVIGKEKIVISMPEKNELPK